jgi:hypothetical protein
VAVVVVVLEQQHLYQFLVALLIPLLLEQVLVV